MTKKTPSAPDKKAPRGENTNKTNTREMENIKADIKADSKADTKAGKKDGPCLRRSAYLASLLAAFSVLFFRLSQAFLDPSMSLAIPYLKDFYLSHFVEDTAALNSVTAIYLDYRVFDSIFEAGILLVAVTGILFIAGSDKGDDYEAF